MSGGMKMNRERKENLEDDEKEGCTKDKVVCHVEERSDRTMKKME